MTSSLAPLRDSAPNATRHRILIVEDDPPLAMSLLELLAEPGIGVHIAQSGIEAVARARELQPEVIILDVWLPGLDGFGVFRILQQDLVLRRSRVIFVSAHAEPGALALARDVGAFGCLRKPFDPEKLCAQVKAALLAGPRPGDSSAGRRPRPDPRPPGGPRILLVHPDVTLRNALASIARERVDPAIAVAQARQAADLPAELARPAPAAILLGARLPDAGGRDVLRQIKASDRFRDIPVFLVSEAGSGIDHAQALSLGAAGVVTRPLDCDGVAAILSEAIGRRA